MKSKAARMIASTFRYFSGYLIPIPVMLDELGIKCQGKKSFEPQVTQCLVGATLSSPPGGMDFFP